MAKNANAWIQRLFQSPWFFGVGMLLFAVEASWLIVFSRFPMVFDEAYHFELIQFFSHRLNPIVLREPANLYNAGAIAHSPSVLYYYVLSFPFRIFEHITPTLSAQIIFLRVLNLLCALGTLFLLRKILLLMRVPRALSQAVVVLFARPTLGPPLGPTARALRKELGGYSLGRSSPTQCPKRGKEYNRRSRGFRLQTIIHTISRKGVTSLIPLRSYSFVWILNTNTRGQQSYASIKYMSDRSCELLGKVLSLYNFFYLGKIEQDEILAPSD